MFRVGWLVSYPQHFGGIVDVVNIHVVVLQMWTELVETSSDVAVLQVDQERSEEHESLMFIWV